VVHLFRCSFPSLSLTTRLVSPRSNNREGTSLKVGVNWQLLTDHQHYDFMSLPSQASTAPQASALSEQGGTWLARNRRNYAGAPGIVEVDIRPSLSTPCMTRRTKRTILYYSEESRVSFLRGPDEVVGYWNAREPRHAEPREERSNRSIEPTQNGPWAGHFGRLIRSIRYRPSTERGKQTVSRTTRLGLQVWPQQINQHLAISSMPALLPCMQLCGESINH